MNDQANITRGTEVYNTGAGCCRYVVLNTYPAKTVTYGQTRQVEMDVPARALILSDMGYTSTIGQSSLDKLPYRITGRVLTEAEILEFEAEAAKVAEQSRREADEAKAAEDARLFDDRASVKGLKLEKAENSKKTRWSLGAANIRKELKAKFPGIKFRVTSKSYSGGCSINVYWINGPTRDAVDAVIQKYSYKSFDSMQDLETIGDTRFTSEYGGAGYVFANRELSEEIRISCGRQYCKRQHIEFEGLNQQVSDIYPFWLSDKVYQILSEADLTNASMIRLEYSDEGYTGYKAQPIA